MRIILIEDERQLAQMLKKGLEEAGYSVDTAYDGEEGLYMLENIPVDAAVLDIMLPKMDGLTVLNRVGCKPQHDSRQRPWAFHCAGNCQGTRRKG